MGAFENFPYTNFHDLNLDWICRKIEEMDLDRENVGAAVRAVLADLVADGTIEAWVAEAVAAQAPLTKIYTEMVANDSIVDWTLQSMAQLNDEVLVCGFKNTAKTVETLQSMIMTVSIEPATYGKILATYKVDLGEVGTCAVYNGVVYFKTASLAKLERVSVSPDGSSITNMGPLNVTLDGAPDKEYVCGSDADGIKLVCDYSGDWYLYDVDVSAIPATVSNPREIQDPPLITAQRQGVSLKGDRLYWCNGGEGVDVFRLTDTEVLYSRTLNLEDRPSGLWDMGELEVFAPSVSDNGDFWIGAQFFDPVGQWNTGEKTNFVRNWTIARGNAVTSVIGNGTPTRVRQSEIQNITLHVDASLPVDGYRDGTYTGANKRPFSRIADAIYYAQSLGVRTASIFVHGNHSEIAFEVNDIGPSIRVSLAAGASLQVGQVEVVGKAWLTKGTYEYIQVTQRGICTLEDVTVANTGWAYNSVIPLDSVPAYPYASGYDCGVNIMGFCQVYGLTYTGAQAELVRVWHGGVLTGLVTPNITPRIRQLQGGMVTVSPFIKDPNDPDSWIPDSYALLNSTELAASGDQMSSNYLPFYGTAWLTIRMTTNVPKTYRVPLAMASQSGSERRNVEVVSYGAGPSLYRLSYDLTVTRTSIKIEHVMLEIVASDGTVTLAVDAGVSPVDYAITAVTIG